MNSSFGGAGEGFLCKHVSPHVLVFFFFVVHNPEIYTHTTILNIYSIFIGIPAR